MQGVRGKLRWMPHATQNGKQNFIAVRLSMNLTPEIGPNKSTQRNVVSHLLSKSSHHSFFFGPYSRGVITQKSLFRRSFWEPKAQISPEQQVPQMTTISRATPTVISNTIINCTLRVPPSAVVHHRCLQCRSSIRPPTCQLTFALHKGSGTPSAKYSVH